MAEIDKPIYLAMYTFRIRRMFKKEKCFEFDEIPEKDNKYRKNDLIDIFSNLFNEEEKWDIKIEKKEGEEEISKTFPKGLILKKYNILEKDRIVEGIINYGIYGYDKDEIAMREDSCEFTRTVDKDSLVADPYYFYIKIPKKEKVGCLFLEYKNGTGIKDNFSRGLSLKFKDYDDLYVDISRKEPIESEAIKEKGEISSLEIIIDSSKNITSNTIKTSKSKYIVYFDKKNRLSPNKIVKEMKYIKNYIKNIFPDFGSSQQDSIKAKTKYKNRNVNVDLESDGGFLLPLIEITDKLKFKDFDEGNNPRPESLREWASKFTKSNFSEIWDEDIFKKE
ncbi:MAG: hypothetical protein KO253_04580 [Methanobrevibacter arboriphilus]|nr:hypothetical protein [Methanobrevibacter arboriphilus]